MIPFHCGSLLPPEQRDTSPTFRRVRGFNRYQLDLHTGAELIAFVRLIGVKNAAYIFGWNKGMVGAYTAISQHPPMAELAGAFEEANRARLDEETGWAILKSMIAGGFRRGSVPEVVRRALQTRRGRGESTVKIARQLGHVSQHQVQAWITPRPPRRNARAEAVARLAVG